ncbi:MAG: hypothetical protein EXS09_06590 [Gemmataceae bacterium]|nr:hypothetical protein [Gemmataceae bacterium]
MTTNDMLTPPSYMHRCQGPRAMNRTSLSLLVFSFTIGCLQTAVAQSESTPTGDLAKKLADVKFEQYSTAPGYSEGPTWRNGEVYFCSGALWKVDANKKLHKYMEINPAGTVLRGDGHLLIADNKHKAIVDLAPDGKLGVVADQFQGKPLRGLNDLTVDAKGNVYWTDPEGSSVKTPVGNVYRVRPDGRVDQVASGLAFPNGLDVDPASKFLYVIESQTQKILRYPITEDGLGKGELFYDLRGSGGDGCVFDAEGNLWVADFHRPDTGKGRITVLSPEAKVLAYLPLPTKVVSNIAFGGKGHDEIFCTTGDPPGVFHAKTGVKGFAGHPGKPMAITQYLNVAVLKPHVDAEVIRKLVKASTEGKGISVEGITELKVRQDVNALIVELELYRPQYRRDLLLLEEIKRLGGKARLEVFAADWLRSMLPEEDLAIFARIVEIELNENSDGHATPKPKAMNDRVTDEWLKKLYGQEQLRGLQLSGTAVTSAGLVHLKDLTKLERLSVCLTAVDDEGLKHLAKLTKMKRMAVCSSKVTGSGFAHLEGMKEIESINLHSSPASDAGLEAIGKLTSLKRLEIVHTKVTDAGLKHLAGMVNLRQLHIHGPETTAAALPYVGGLKELYELDVYDKAASNATCEQIGKLPKLRQLMLTNGPVDDAGVRHLSGLATLEELSLDSSKITDASVETIAGLKGLRKLRIRGTGISEGGLKKLQAALPKAEISK